MVDTNDYLSALDTTTQALWDNMDLPGALILVLYEGPEHPKYCSSMPRTPKPPDSVSLDLTESGSELINIIKNMFENNYAFHDGAIMLQAHEYENSISITGWSFRLYPPESNAQIYANRGSAYNSAIHFSFVESVIRIYCLGENEVILIQNGLTEILFKRSV